MHQGKLVFAPLMAHLPISTFRRCVARHRGDFKVQDFHCLDQFLATAFAQLTYRESLRDIEIDLRAQSQRLYYIGFRCATISRNTQFKRLYLQPVDRINTHVIYDQTGVLSVYYSNKDYPAPLRRAVIKDDAGKRITFLTNNFSPKPELIAQLCRQLWQVELFFKWIKQYLRIKAF